MLVVPKPRSQRGRLGPVPIPGQPGGPKRGGFASKPGDFRYARLPSTYRVLWLAVFVSISLHAVVILGFNHRPSVKKAPPVVEVVDTLMMMPILDDLEEEKPRELVEDEPIEAPATSVPMLADVPVMIPSVSSFVQPLDLTIPMKNDGTVSSVVAIPVNIQRGRPDDSKIKNLFNIADLDRRPEPVSQVMPVFPYDMRRDYEYAMVRVGFIIDAKGNVIMPYIISTPNRGFEAATLQAVSKWKFRPGMKGGRKVNTRAEQPIEYRVTIDGK